jgi:hypothetical protein
VKKPLFAGLAFARVTILNIRKSHGVSCPGRSSESQCQPADLPYSVQEWNARRGAYSSVLLQYFDASLSHGVCLSRDISDPATHHFAKRNGFRESFSNTRCMVCISGRVLEISFDLSWGAEGELEASGPQGCWAELGPGEIDAATAACVGPGEGVGIQCRNCLCCATIEL